MILHILATLGLIVDILAWIGIYGTGSIRMTLVGVVIQTSIILTILLAIWR